MFMCILFFFLRTNVLRSVFLSRFAMSEKKEPSFFILIIVLVLVVVVDGSQISLIRPRAAFRFRSMAPFRKRCICPTASSRRHRP